MDNIYKLLIIEDDKDMAKALQNLLVKWNFETVICGDFDNILSIYEKEEPHIILLDINIPSFDGFYWCKKIREVSSAPIIFCSSRNSNMDIVMAINNGGDDYIQKPFDSHVLVAKLQAIIRRTYEYITAESHLIESNNVILNLNDAKIYFQDQSLELTKNEFKILKTLMENKGKVVSRDNLMRQLWNDDIYVNENTLTVNINRLRNRLEGINVDDFILTKKGMGYIIQ
ncbi:response regulator transcription factor [Bacillus velezensis]|uniref:Response regulator transcription factor n=2 Tax=Bacillus velezensis TaxID=492670 RepID=A7Z0W1_BACVZ|nr:MULTISPECIES: response regulator transcription factor [Bacillus amyloliquefaciens group]ABS72637.1 response regulator transcription factor [Bacillus velezensis FZB42]AGZ54904.1 two-component response regulator [Bacillus amyloliquefaciens CC178]MBT9269408.1 response regulator transcription factor [Bacillus velezensis]MCF7601147.1 response regulator transcription factor [Bacillus velezensis]MDF0745697.1 response regulator transcription factor [Bacillus velezensis]